MLRSAAQKHHPLWAVQFHSQLPPSESLITWFLPHPIWSPLPPVPTSKSHQLVSPALCPVLEPMQELMSLKTYSLSPRDCLKTCLFQKWQRMVAPPVSATCTCLLFPGCDAAPQKLYLLTPHAALSLLLGLQDWDQGRLRLLGSQIGEQGAPGPTLPESPFPAQRSLHGSSPANGGKRKMSGGQHHGSGRQHQQQQQQEEKPSQHLRPLQPGTTCKHLGFLLSSGHPTADPDS